MEATAVVQLEKVLVVAAQEVLSSGWTVDTFCNADQQIF